MLDVTIVCIALVAVPLGCFWLVVLWVGDRTSTAFELSPPHLDPISGSRDRLAISDTQGPYIPMPDRLRTRDEMVLWMTEELPKLVVGTVSSRKG